MERRLLSNVSLPPFSGEACIACPIEVRDLHAVAANVVSEWERQSRSPSPDYGRLTRKMAELTQSVRRFDVIVKAHFADRSHAWGE